MTATITIDAAGQIDLPEPLKRIPIVTEGVMEDGVLVLPKLGIKVNTAAALRAEREAQTDRALPR